MDILVGGSEDSLWGSDLYGILLSELEYVVPGRSVSNFQVCILWIDENGSAWDSGKSTLVSNCTNDPYGEKIMRSEISRIYTIECRYDSWYDFVQHARCLVYSVLLADMRARQPEKQCLTSIVLLVAWS